jgi:hypothetical protein
MSFSTALCFGALLVLTMLAVCACSLRASAGYYFVAQLSWPRTVAVTLFVVALTLAIWAAGVWLGGWLAGVITDPTSPASDPWLVELPVRMLFLAISFAVPWLCVKLWIGGTWIESGQIALLSCILSVICDIVLLLIVRSVAVDSCQVGAGSMAPTICGPTTLVSCPNCGFEFRLAHSARLALPPELPAVCPNCRYATPIASQHRHYGADRFLVSKLDDPHRWDVIVFRQADEPGAHLSRLVGLPGEQVEIFGGDVFINGKRLQKTPGRQADLWLPVHDTRAVPRQLGPHSPHWQPAEPDSHWQQSAEQWQFSATDDNPDRLDFSGDILDQLAYNQGNPLPETDLRLPVGDVMIECTLGDFSGPGGLDFSWLFGPDRKVVASISAGGKVVLQNLGQALSEDGNPLSAKEEALLPRPLGKGTRLIFAVRDGLAYVSDGHRPQVFVTAAPLDLKTARVQTARPDPCRLGISAHGCQGTLARIAIFRDVYYRSPEEISPLLRRQGNHTPSGALSLGPLGFFVLGDNSARSLDSRFMGEIPRGSVLGLARWIYWPLCRWHELH